MDKKTATRDGCLSRIAGGRFIEKECLALDATGIVYRIEQCHYNIVD
jgi:hypothetical protein